MAYVATSHLACAGEQTPVFNQWQDLSLDGGTRPVPGVDIDLALEPLDLLRDCFRTLIDVFDENPVRINLLGSEDLSEDLVLPFETVVLLLDVTDLLFLVRTFLFEQDFYRINSLGRLLVTRYSARGSNPILVSL